MSKYQILINILDHIRAEARSAGFTKHFPDLLDTDSVNASRARAYIHLFLKVKFGILDPSERETYITDGANDGGKTVIISIEKKKELFSCNLSSA